MLRLVVYIGQSSSNVFFPRQWLQWLGGWPVDWLVHWVADLTDNCLVASWLFGWWASYLASWLTSSLIDGTLVAAGWWGGLLAREEGGGDVPLKRVWFLALRVWNRVYKKRFCLEQGGTYHPFRLSWLCFLSGSRCKRTLFPLGSRVYSSKSFSIASSLERGI